MLDLSECDVMEKLDKELTSDISLVARKSFNNNEDGKSGNDKGIKGMDVEC